MSIVNHTMVQNQRGKNSNRLMSPMTKNVNIQIVTYNNEHNRPPP